MSRRTNFEKTDKQLLPVKFTDDELQAIGLQLAATHERIGELTVQKKSEADRYKDLIENATAEASRLAKNRINGWENRYVDCTTTYDFKKSTEADGAHRYRRGRVRRADERRGVEARADGAGRRALGEPQRGVSHDRL